MKQNLKFRLAAASLLLSGAVWAAPVTITNAGFEDPVVATDGGTGSIPSGWTAFNSGNVITLNPSAANDLSAQAPQGDNVALVTSSAVEDGLAQTLTSTFQADATYVLTAKVANTKFTTGFPGYRVQLVANGTMLAEDDNFQAAAEDAVVTSTVNYSYNAGLHAGLVGQPLEIRLLSKGLSASQEVAFDDVQLTVTLANPAANPGGPYSVNPGASLSLDGSGSLPSDGATITTYEWDLNNDNTFGDVTGATPAAISDAVLMGTWGMTAGPNTIQLRVTDSAAKTSTASGIVTLVDATTYTGPNGAYNNDTWNNAANWDVGVPSGTIDAVIGTGRHAGVALSTTPVYTGDLTLEANSQLTIGEGSTITGLRALGTGSITFNTGSRITLRWSTASTHSQNFVMAGDATFAIGSSTAAHNDDRTLTGVISGAGQMIVRSTNGQRLTIQNTNPSWSGGLIMGGALSENKNESLRANAAGAFGTGNVTIDDGVGLLISVADAIGDAATLSLSGGDGEETFKLNMAASDTVDKLIVDGYPQPAGTYGSLASTATYKKAWITGASLLTVASASTDTTAPTVTFAGTGAGGGTTNVYSGEPVTYTIAFSEPHAPALTAGDLENSTATPVTIGSVTPLPLTGGMTTVSYRVVVTPTATGTVNLQIKSGTVINDLFGNPMVVPVADNDTLTVNALPPIQGQLGVWKPWANGGINPATGNPWQVGDTYRLAFVTSANGVRNATSTDIADYNTHVQTMAAGSTSYPLLGNGTWKVIGSTATVSAKVNTGTDAAGGVATLLMDGSTMFASNNSDFWNGTALFSTGRYLAPYLDENGNDPGSVRVFTGTVAAGNSEAARVLGGSTEVPPKVTTGLTYPNDPNRWIIQFNEAATSTTMRFYALSEPLTLQAIGGGGTFAAWIGGYPGVGAFTGVGDDADADGIDNGVENFFGTDPSASSSGLVAGAVTGNTFIFTHPQNATPASDLTAAYQWSKDLATFYASGASDGSSTVTFTTQANTPAPGTTTVTATVTGTATSKLFVNIKVTQP